MRKKLATKNSRGTQSRKGRITRKNQKSAIASPSFQNILHNLLQKGDVIAADRDLFIANYNFFEKNRSMIQQRYSREWVAALDQQLYHAPDLVYLQIQMRDRPNARYAYVEQIL